MLLLFLPFLGFKNSTLKSRFIIFLSLLVFENEVKGFQSGIQVSFKVGIFFILFYFFKNYGKQMLFWSDFRPLRKICSGQSFPLVGCHLA